MPEKPEVITVAKKLKTHLLNRRFVKVDVYHDNIIAGISVSDFKEKLVNQTIHDITTRGKFIVFKLDDYYLLVHLRMEGKFFYRTKDDEILKHEHVIFTMDNDVEVRYHDVRKFGKMYLIEKDKLETTKPISDLGLEVWDKNLTSKYLSEKFKNKNLPIKTVLLDQSIITGIGNIYDDEILFLSRIHPLTKAKYLSDKELDDIIKYSVEVLDKAIAEGGTTIRSYTSEEGVHGLFQHSLKVHNHEGDACPECNTKIEKIKVGGRGTYFCPNCQKLIEKK